jgi:hypothetical protein
MIAASLGAKGGVYISVMKENCSSIFLSKQLNVRESSVTALYCDHASNAQLWFCTTGFINRASVSMPAGEFGDASGIVHCQGLLRGLLIPSSLLLRTASTRALQTVTGVMRFRRIRSQGAQAKGPCYC